MTVIRRGFANAHQDDGSYSLPIGKGVFYMKEFFFKSRSRDTRFDCDWSSDVCSSDLTRHTTTSERELVIHRYWYSDCKNCLLKAKCTPGKERRVSRWEDEAVLDAMQARLDHFPEAMRIRRQTGEHPFGTLKLWMGSAHFLMRTLKKVATEMSLHVLAYNLKRVMKILGIGPLMQAMRA